MLYSTVLCNLSFGFRALNMLVWTSLVSSVQDDGSGVSAQCGCAVESPGRWWHSLVSGARRSWPIVGCRRAPVRLAAVVGGEVRSRHVAGRVARTSPLAQCHGDFWCHDDVTPLGTVTDSLTPSVVADQITTPVVWPITPGIPAWCVGPVVSSWCLWAGCFFLMYQSGLFLLDVSSICSERRLMTPQKFCLFLFRTLAVQPGLPLASWQIW
jgi:hypothetical protein